MLTTNNGHEEADTKLRLDDFNKLNAIIGSYRFDCLLRQVQGTIGEIGKVWKIHLVSVAF